jgi:hypothetical protein
MFSAGWTEQDSPQLEQKGSLLNSGTLKMKKTVLKLSHLLFESACS